MRHSILYILTILFCFSLFVGQVNAQFQPDTLALKKLIHYISELEFQVALTNYVEKLFVTYGIDNLPREKYLISLMRLVNNEMKRRIKNQREAREKYFNELKTHLSELQSLKKRLRAAGISELNSFVQELEARMRLSIESGEINYKKMKVFEDALQLLYIAEEMIKLDQFNRPEQLDQKISNSKNKLLQAFGEIGDVDNTPLDITPNIFNLFEEWKKTDELQFETRLLDVKLARVNLIKSASLEQLLNMFNDHLRLAYSAFNFNDYDLADRLLEDLVKTYSKAGIKDFEDVYFYWAESNFALYRFLRAKEIYQRLINEYPNSAFLSKCYARLIQISFKLDEKEEVLKWFNQYQNVASPAEEEYYDIQFISALTYYKLSAFDKALDIFLTFSEDNPYYSFAQYLVGTIYASGQNYEMAKEIFQKLVLSKNTPPEIYSRSLYKLALISYEKGEYVNAIQYLSFIPENYSRYDKVLNVLSWAFFMFEQVRTSNPEERDYTQAKYFAKRLMDEYYASEHRMEAESLLAYIYQMENKPDMAINLYREVYESKAKRESIDGFFEERDYLRQLYAQAKTLEEEAIRQNDANAYIRASDVASALEEKIYKMELSEYGAVGSALTQEINQIIEQLNKLEELKKQAQSEKNEMAIMKIDSMKIRLMAILNLFPDKYLTTATIFNWFDAYPVTHKISENAFRISKQSRLREQIGSEISALDTRINLLRQRLEREKLSGNYKYIISLEQKINQLLEIRKQYDQLYAASFDLVTEPLYAEFDKWGDFGAFGIIDVHFSQRNRLKTRMTRIANLYNSVVELTEHHREMIEDKLKKIEAEIRFMTMKARLEERVRLRAERERSFRETYFDKRTSEFEEQ